MRYDLIRSGRSGRRFPLVALVLLAGACSEDRPSSPTSTPANPGGGFTATQGALVSGQVNRDGRAANDIEVRVDGQSLAARTDAGGRFQLDGVATGDRVILFVTAAGQAPLPLPGVQAGERIEISVALSGASARLRSIARGAPQPPQGQGPLTLRVSPDSWNTNWSRSSGTVTAFLDGGGFVLIDAATVVLLGDDPAEPPLAARHSQRNGQHVRATFGKADALDLLLPPVLTGQSRTVQVQFVQHGTTVLMPATIHIVGPNR